MAGLLTFKRPLRRLIYRFQTLVKIANRFQKSGISLHQSQAHLWPLCPLTWSDCKRLVSRTIHSHRSKVIDKPNLWKRNPVLLAQTIALCARRDHQARVLLISHFWSSQQNIFAAVRIYARLKCKKDPPHRNPSPNPGAQLYSPSRLEHYDLRRSRALSLRQTRCHSVSVQVELAFLFWSYRCWPNLLVAFL